MDEYLQLSLVEDERRIDAAVALIRQRQQGPFGGFLRSQNDEPIRLAFIATCDSPQDVLVCLMDASEAVKLTALHRLLQLLLPSSTTTNTTVATAHIPVSESEALEWVSKERFKTGEKVDFVQGCLLRGLEDELESVRFLTVRCLGRLLQVFAALRQPIFHALIFSAIDDSTCVRRATLRALLSPSSTNSPSLVYEAADEHCQCLAVLLLDHQDATLRVLARRLLRDHIWVAEDGLRYLLEQLSAFPEQADENFVDPQGEWASTRECFQCLGTRHPALQEQVRQRLPQASPKDNVRHGPRQQLWQAFIEPSLSIKSSDCLHGDGWIQLCMLHGRMLVYGIVSWDPSKGSIAVQATDDHGVVQGEWKLKQAWPLDRPSLDQRPECSDDGLKDGQWLCLFDVPSGALSRDTVGLSLSTDSCASPTPPLTFNLRDYRQRQLFAECFLALD
jgi:hypothetical protein